MTTGRIRDGTVLIGPRVDDVEFRPAVAGEEGGFAILAGSQATFASEGQPFDGREARAIDDQERSLKHLPDEDFAVGQDEVSPRGLANLANLAFFQIGPIAF